MIQHGEVTMYVYGCRCADCTEAQRVAQNWQNLRRAERLDELPPEKHGLSNTYVNWSCRCDACVEAYRVYRRDYFRARKAKMAVIAG